MNGVYYIENTVDEFHTRVSGYFETLDAAKEALKECSNWYCPKGTGWIYFKKFGLNQNSQLVYKNE